MSATAFESCSSIVLVTKVLHCKGTDGSSGSSVGCERLNHVKRNVSLFKYRHEVNLDAFLCPATTLWRSLIGCKTLDGAVCNEAL